jgi:hypothetical protein
VPLDDDEELLSPSAARGKRSAAKRSYVESDIEDEQEDQEDGYVPMSKRVKTEPVDEPVGVEEEVDDEVSIVLLGGSRCEGLQGLFSYWFSRLRFLQASLSARCTWRFWMGKVVCVLDTWFVLRRSVAA